MNGKLLPDKSEVMNTSAKDPLKYLNGKVITFQIHYFYTACNLFQTNWMTTHVGGLYSTVFYILLSLYSLTYMNL